MTRIKCSMNCEFVNRLGNCGLQRIQLSEFEWGTSNCQNYIHNGKTKGTP